MNGSKIRTVCENTELIFNCSVQCIYFLKNRCISCVCHSRISEVQCFLSAAFLLTKHKHDYNSVDPYSGSQHPCKTNSQIPGQNHSSKLKCWLIFLKSQLNSLFLK